MTSNDIRDILNIKDLKVSKDEILDLQHKNKILLPYYNAKVDLPPVIQTNNVPFSNRHKANFGMQQVRHWEWASFVNSARQDGVSFFHWQRASDRYKDYPFAKFNKKIEILKYTDTEYKNNLVSKTWTREETDRLFDMCERFDLRFIVIQGRWNYEEYENAVKRTTEDLKDRYYSICNILTKIRGGNANEVKFYDAEHETRRKQQLDKLYSRTPEQIGEEKVLLRELRKIEQRKYEVDRKTQDLKKLISSTNKKNDSRVILKINRNRKRNCDAIPVRSTKFDPNNFEVTTIKFPNIKNSGVSIRTLRMKIPANVNPKKAINVKLALQSLKIEPNPIPTEKVCQNYNDLRNDIVLLAELKAVCKSSSFELQSLKYQLEKLNSGSVVKIEPELMDEIPGLSLNEEDDEEESNSKIM